MNAAVKLSLVPKMAAEHVVDCENLTATALKEKYKDTYSSWRNMKQRAQKKKIPVGAELVQFSSFLKTMGPRPNKCYTLDEIIHGDGYVIGNVRWADKLQQAQNQQHSINLTYNGVTKPLSQWAAEVGTSYQTLYKRYQQNWSPGEILYGKESGTVKQNNIWAQTPWPEGYEPQWERVYQEGRGDGESRLEFYCRYSRILYERNKIECQEYVEEPMPEKMVEWACRYQAWVRDARLKLDEWKKREKFINREEGSLGKATEAKLYDLLHGKPKPYIEKPLTPDQKP